MTAPVLMGAVLIGAVLIVQGLTVTAWHRCLDVPGALGGAMVAAAAALSADLLVLTGGDQPISAVPAVLALAVPAAFVSQLARRDGREQLSASLSATTALTAVSTLGCTYLAAGAGRHGGEVVTVAAISAALTAAVLGRRGPPTSRLQPTSGKPGLAAWVAALALGAVTGLVVAGLSALEPTPGAAIGVAAAVAAAAGVAFVQRTARPRRQLALALPILLAGPVAFVLGRLLVG